MDLLEQSNFTRFLPPDATDTPETLFVPGLNKGSLPTPRFTRRSNSSKFLIYTDGACSRNGNKASRGGCTFVYRPKTSRSAVPPKTPSGHPISYLNLHKLGASKFQLEIRGPAGEAAPQTSNCAELRAVIAALGFRLWNNEECQRLVIATDSSYVVDGSTSWVKKRQRNGWQTATKNPVKNQDLWEELLKQYRLAKEATALADEEDWASGQAVSISPAGAEQSGRESKMCCTKYFERGSSRAREPEHHASPLTTALHVSPARLERPSTSTPAPSFYKVHITTPPAQLRNQLAPSSRHPVKSPLVTCTPLPPVLASTPQLT
ncbi:hypothetical protein OPT61_g1531 [Boeremia exigua]|uniref:Uncharacterized protein n=1 Tax=Boeremia exigua TaxID=749465 RepID=A0ACC2IPY0_9PLEO|nr:hypothetical protein OPT61_g1531 [Boeremia exigua]